MRALLLACALLAACGDNLPPPAGPPLAQAETMFIAAHLDDDMIFMQPELLHALEAGSVTTVYVTTGDPVLGSNHADDVFHATMVAYASAVGSSDWDCGYVRVGSAPIKHCRLRDRPVSLIGLDVPDGGIPGTGPLSLLRLVDGDLSTLPILGHVGGATSEPALIDELAALIEVTQPSTIHMLDLEADHGRDHSSHLFSSAFAFWGAAQIGYAGAIVSHRGYDVEPDPVTFVGSDHDAAVHMLSYFEACYSHCAPCGTACDTIDPSHDTWLSRQYSAARVEEASGVLSSPDGSGCITSQASLGDCGTAPVFELSADGHLSSGGQCLASTEDGGLVMAPCQNAAEQYWLFDTEGSLWNGRPPIASGDMSLDHVRCLSGASVPTCGAHLHPAWAFRR